ncbi:MAG TPA: DNA-binding response regulator [Betaproteobacteria bacterium]|jgi:DNA-binding NarL/FixJ family response regulator|nr:DNA-binding response regulator [Betaproteobacteria bacterium]
MDMKFRIMVVDDHAIVLHGLTQLINNSPDLEVTIQAQSAEAAIELLKANPLPDLVVTDISLPGLSGIDLTKTLTAQFPKLPVLVLSMHEEMVHGERAFRVGAKGYLTKQEAADKVVVAIRRILSGEDYLSERMQTMLLHQIRNKPKSGAISVLSRLTDREYEIFRLIGMGMSSSEIADKLSRSVKTVEAHRANLKQKLGLRNAIELNRFAVHYADRERI